MDEAVSIKPPAVSPPQIEATRLLLFLFQVTVELEKKRSIDLLLFFVDLRSGKVWRLR